MASGKLLGRPVPEASTSIVSPDKEVVHDGAESRQFTSRANPGCRPKGPIVGQVPLHALRRGAHFTHGVEGQGVLTGSEKGTGLRTQTPSVVPPAHRQVPWEEESDWPTSHVTSESSHVTLPSKA